jgi:hypothetical protein
MDMKAFAASCLRKMLKAPQGCRISFPAAYDAISLAFPHSRPRALPCRSGAYPGHRRRFSDRFAHRHGAAARRRGKPAVYWIRASKNVAIKMIVLPPQAYAELEKSPAHSRNRARPSSSGRAFRLLPAKPSWCSPGKRSRTSPYASGSWQPPQEI